MREKNERIKKLLTVASLSLDHNFISLGKNEWLKLASCGSYFFETVEDDVIQSFIDTWAQRSDIIFEKETNTFLYPTANWRMMAVGDYQTVSPEMTVILRKCK